MINLFRNTVDRKSGVVRMRNRTILSDGQLLLRVRLGNGVALAVSLVDKRVLRRLLRVGRKLEAGG